ncbi:MAG: hypothetical protein GY732_03370, partial [Gammaproteobacteria bacterium]|nr:hypothetical protein [Gammaproteobacteria bacterium]
YGMNLVNSAGNFNNFTLDNTVIAGIRLASGSNPAEFSNVVLTNAVTPYELVGQDLTATITGGYDFSDISVAKSYIRVGGTLLNNMTLTPNPIGAGSVWRVYSSITVPSAYVLTVEDGAVLKFDLNQILTIDGSLVVGDGDGLGTKAVFTSILDDTVGGDTNGDAGATTPAWNNWGYIRVNDNSTIDIDNAIIRYNSYGIYQSGTAPTSFSITNTDFSDVYYYGLYMTANTGDNVVWNLDTVSFTDVSASVSYPGIYAQTNNDSSLTGTWDKLTMNNIGGTAIYIDDNSTGTVNPTISGLTIGNTGTIGQYGVHLDGGASTTPIFNATAGNNSISGGSYNLLLVGVGGTYGNLTLNGASTASIYISGAMNPLGGWDDTTIILTNAPTPYRLMTDLPATIGVLGSGSLDLGFNLASSNVTRNYLSFGNTSTFTNMTLVADPLNTGSSVYRTVSNITVPSGFTLTVEDGAVVKFNAGQILTVNGSLIVGDGDGLGTKAVFTSILDDTVGGDTNGDAGATTPAWNNWGYIR